MESHIQKLKQFHGIDRDINLQFKQDNGLFILYNDKWIRLTKKEKQNSIAINIFGWKGGVIIHQLSKQPSELPRINLMVIEKEEKMDYVFIRHGSKFEYIAL